MSLLALVACACAGCDAHRYPAKRGLRWSGEARVAGATDGTALGGPAVGFRTGAELVERPPPVREGFVQHEQPDGWFDAVVGSWGGLELSAAVLTGVAEGNRTARSRSSASAPGCRAGKATGSSMSRRSRSSAFCFPTSASPTASAPGGAFGSAGASHSASRSFRIVPALSWISPGGDQRLLASIGLRVPM